jgi:hypothetical protein
MNLDLLTLCNDYLADAKVSCLGHDTFEGKKRLCNEILEKWGKIPCTDITVHMAHQYLLKRATKSAIIRSMYIVKRAVGCSSGARNMD